MSFRTAWIFKRKKKTSNFFTLFLSFLGRPSVLLCLYSSFHPFLFYYFYIKTEKFNIKISLLTNWICSLLGSTSTKRVKLTMNYFYSIVTYALWYKYYPHEIYGQSKAALNSLAMIILQIIFTSSIVLIRAQERVINRLCFSHSENCLSLFLINVYDSELPNK